MTEIDINLIRGLREQSPKAQRLVLERYGNEVFAQVARMLPSTEDAEEVYQDVFVKVFKNIKMYDEGKSALRTWISRIAYNESITWLRHKRQSVIYFEDREGRIEELSDAEGAPKTAHTLNKVPCIFYDNTINRREYVLNDVARPGLSNIAATVAVLMGLNDYPDVWDAPLVRLK